MLFLLALLFFSLGTSVTALPMNEFHPGAPIAHSSPVSLDDIMALDATPSRYYGCWTPEHVDQKPIAFVLCYNEDGHLERAYNEDNFFNKFKYAELRYKRVMTSEEFKSIFKNSQGSQWRVPSPFHIIGRDWARDILLAAMVDSHLMSARGILAPSNPRSHGCWTPKPTGSSHHIALVLCLDGHGQVIGNSLNPDAVHNVCNGVTPFVRVLNQAHFTDILPRITPPPSAFFPSIKEGHENDELSITMHQNDHAVKYTFKALNYPE